MKSQTVKVQVDNGIEVTSQWLLPECKSKNKQPVLILAHGAGADMHHPFMCFMHEGLAKLGIASIKFNFPYKEAGRKPPDRMPKLEATWRAVIARVRGELKVPTDRLYIGGKSMGGRAASMVAAAGDDLAGLVFLGYPLHPPGKPEKLRADHLKDIRVPMLFIEGTRDPLCKLDILEGVFKTLQAPVQLNIVEDGDHSFNVLKRTGKTEEEVLQGVVDGIGEWVCSVTV